MSLPDVAVPLWSGDENRRVRVAGGRGERRANTSISRRSCDADDPGSGPWYWSDTGATLDGALDVGVVVARDDGRGVLVWTAGEEMWSGSSGPSPTATSLGRGEPLLGRWPELVVRSPDGQIEVISLDTGSRSDLDVTGEILAIWDGNLLARTDDGALLRWSTAGPPVHLADGVADAMWGSLEAEPDPSQWATVDPSTVTPLDLVAAPGERFEVPGAPGPLSIRSDTGQEAVLQPDYSMESGEGRIAVRLPWAYGPSLDPLVAGPHHVIVHPWVGDPVEVGQLQVTADGTPPPRTPSATSPAAILRQDGVGPVPFGATWPDVRDALVPILGEPAQTPEYQSLGIAAWFADRSLLRLRFDAPEDSGRLLGWQLNGLGDATPEIWDQLDRPILTTTTALTTGATVSDIVAIHPDARFYDPTPLTWWEWGLTAWSTSSGDIVGSLTTGADQFGATINCLSAASVPLDHCGQLNDVD